MDYKYIEQLLSRYFEATATLKEEQILKAFFAQDDEELPRELRCYKSLFEAMEKDDVLGTDFDEHILSLINPQTESQQDKEVSKARVISLHERFKPLLRAAAVVAVILTLSTAVNQSFRVNDVWTDEEQIAHYQDEMRKAAIAAASADSVLLYSEGITIKADSLVADTTILSRKGYLE